MTLLYQVMLHAQITEHNCSTVITAVLIIALNSVFHFKTANTVIFLLSHLKLNSVTNVLLKNSKL